MAVNTEGMQLGNGIDNLKATWEANGNFTSSMMRRKENLLLLYRERDLG